MRTLAIAPARAPRRQRGFSLVELMVALALALVVTAGLVTVFVNNSRTREEADQTNQQIENGRYAMQLLSDDLRQAGYLAQFDIVNASLTTPATKPDPCSSALADLAKALPLHVQGYYQGATLSCLSDVASNTDIVVVRRVATCVAGSANCAVNAGAPYFQASLCNGATELGSTPTSGWYRLDTTTANLDRTRRDCTTPAERRQYLTRIYFIANNDNPGDGIPTLKRAELGAGGFTIVPLVEGIQSLRIEYGIDTNNDGIPDAFSANPDGFGACAGASCVANWRNAMAAKLYMLARTIKPSGASYTDAKLYQLGLDANGNTVQVGPFNDTFRRHVYTAEVRFNNPAGRREQ